MQLTPTRAWKRVIRREIPCDWGVCASMFSMAICSKMFSVSAVFNDDLVELLSSRTSLRRASVTVANFGHGRSSQSQVRAKHLDREGTIRNYTKTGDFPDLGSWKSQRPPLHELPAVTHCLFVSYLFRVGHSTDMCSLLQENLLGGKKESVSRSYVHVCWKKVMKMKRFNEEVYTGSPKVNLSCFREFDEMERFLRYSDLKKFMVCACLMPVYILQGWPDS